jgi:hypothetical protein
MKVISNWVKQKDMDNIIGQTGLNTKEILKMG